MPWPRDDPFEYFAVRGFTLDVEADTSRGDFVAAIRLTDLPESDGREYARGATLNDAATSAMRRFHVEQDPDPPLPRRLP